MPEDFDPLQVHYPAFAALRDNLGMQTIRSEGIGQWMVVLAAPTFEMMIGDDHADWDFSIKPKGRKNYTSITRVLHRLGLWGDPHVRPDATELARVFEDNLDKVLKALESDVFWRSLGYRE